VSSWWRGLLTASRSAAVPCDTGPRQPEAIGLYERAGYRSIGSFGAYIGAADADDSLFYERTFHVS
jgi:hypothetical protein